MRYLEHFQMPGPWHMAFDEVLLDRVDRGLSKPFFRLYTWSPWCITLGSFQVADEQLDAQRVHDAGYQIAQRATGGRAVFHAQELTYSLCAPKDIGPWAKTLGSTYDWISERLLAGFAQVGFDGAMEKGDVSALESQATRHTAKPPCFTSASRAEIVWQGRKVVGSAQRRSRNAFLQHGSILLGDAHADLVNFLEFPDSVKPELRKDLMAHAVCLGQIPGVDARLESVTQAVRNSFAAELGFGSVELATEDELRAVSEKIQGGGNRA